MINRKIGLSVILSIPLLILIVINILDISNIYKGSGDYPFGSDFFSPYSIYQSKNVYIIYQILFTLCLTITILLAFKNIRKAFFIFLILDIVFFIYPIITNT